MAHPRYLEPKQGPSQSTIMAMTPTRERFPINPNFSSVNARYLEPKANQPAGTPRGLEECTFDVRRHKENVNSRYPDLLPRFLDEKNYQPRADSPRRMIESRIDETKRERALWRADTISGKTATFDDLWKLTAKVEENAPKTKPINAPSRVKEYLLRGTASQQMRDSSRASRPQSPQRANSPSRAHWHSAGVSSTSFENHQKDSSSQRWFARQEKHVTEVLQKLQTLKVEPDHVPRVATLAVAEQVKREGTGAQPTYELDEPNLNTPRHFR